MNENSDIDNHTDDCTVDFKRAIHNKHNCIAASRLLQSTFKRD